MVIRKGSQNTEREELNARPHQIMSRRSDNGHSDRIMVRFKLLCVEKHNRTTQ